MTKSTSRLVADLSSPKESVRRKAKNALGSLPPGVPVDILPLVQASKSTAEETRFWALTALGQIYQSFDEVVPEIAECLRDTSSGNRQVAVNCLGGYAEFAGQFLDDIAQLLNDPNEFVRQEAARAISRFPHLPDRVVAQVVASLHDDAPGVRRAAAIAVKMLGPFASPQKDALADRIRLAPQSAEADQLRTALSFMSFCREVKAGALVLKLLSDDEFERETAILCASYMTDPSVEVLDRLDTLLDGASFEIQLAAAEALRRQAARAVHLKRGLRDRLESKRWAGRGPEVLVRQHLIVAVELMERVRAH